MKPLVVAYAYNDFVTFCRVRGATLLDYDYVVNEDWLKGRRGAKQFFVTSLAKERKDFGDLLDVLRRHGAVEVGTCQ